ncbi:MAG: LamG-like jellyroll fold domain-containing protein [Planctomycetota bacterium]
MVPGTYNAVEIRIYVNGLLTDTNPVVGLSLSQNTEGLAIGNRSDDLTKPLIGKVDDVRVYDYGLSAAQVAHLATEGTGYIPLLSEVNLFDLESAGQEAINIRDLAVLLNSWLEQKLWP